MLSRAAVEPSCDGVGFVVASQREVFGSVGGTFVFLGELWLGRHR